MDLDPYGLEPDAPDVPVHVGVWLAFAACGFMIIVMSGFSAMMVAILVLHGEAGSRLLEMRAPVPPTETAEVRRKHALDAIRAGDYERAVAVTSEAVAADPRQHEMAALREISIDLRNRKNHPDAARTSDRVAQDRVRPAAARVQPPARPRVPVVEQPTAPVIAPPLPSVVAPEPEPEPAPVPPAPGPGPSEPAVVYVFVPGTVKPRVLEEVLGSQLRGTTVTAFGGFRDLSQALEKAPADAVIAPKQVLDALGLPIHLQGRDALGSAEQRYLLLGTRALTPAERATAVIGTVDVAGRESSTRFVARLLNAPAIAPVKRVAEEADLLSLLQFGAADAILLPEPAARALMHDTRMSLTAMEVGPGASLPAVSILDDTERRRIEAAVGGLGIEANAKVGVVSWGP